MAAPGAPPVSCGKAAAGAHDAAQHGAAPLPPRLGKPVPAEAELRRAANEPHAMFLLATDHVLQDDARPARFNIPPALWPRIRQSRDNRRTRMITGRFDFRLTEDGLNWGRDGAVLDQLRAAAVARRAGGKTQSYQLRDRRPWRCALACA